LAPGIRASRDQSWPMQGKQITAQQKNASAKFQDRHCECLYSLASMLAERLYRLESVPIRRST
jgi:hypothetical protein